MGASVVPVVPAHMRNLQLANTIREGRAQLKRAIRCWEVDVCDVIADPPDVARNMTVVELLSSVHRVGRYRAGLMCSGICSPEVRLAQLRVWQRLRLVTSVTEALGR